MEIILPMAPMLTPSAIKIMIRLPAKKDTGTNEVENITSTFSFMLWVSIKYSAVISAEDSSAAATPIIMPP